MELVYIWIKKYKNIEKQGFNFSNKYRIKYNYDSKELQIIITPNDIPNFFGNNIQSVTGIIGENGAGKSNILDFIKYNLGSFAENFSQPLEADIPSSIIVFDSFIFIQQSLEILNQEELQLKGFNLLKFGKLVGNTFSDLYNEQTFIAANYALENISYIFYSNLYDSRPEPFKLTNLKNISTNYLLKYEKREDIRYKPAYTLNQSIDIESYEVFEANEVERQINFIYQFQSETTLPFEIPNKLIIEINSSNNNYSLKQREEWFNHYQIPEFTKIDDEVGELLDDEKFSDTDKFKFLIALNITKILLDTYPDSFRKVNLSDLIENIKNLRFNNKNPNDESLEGHINNINNFFTILNKLIAEREDVELGIDFDSIPLDPSLDMFNFYKTIAIDLLPNQKENFINLIYNYNIISGGKKFLNFNWRDLSSGEKAMLNLFSRFNSLIRPRNIIDDDKSHLIVLIDEGEIFYHPQWQKRFIMDVLGYISNLFKDKKLQFILTSNSPFFASDIPRSNIIFLRKNEETPGCEVLDLLEMKETFAANIHTLLADSFFMKGGLVGEFAKAKINDLINYLKGEESSIESNSEAQKLINIIGEPIVKRQLQQMMDSRKLEALNDKIDDFENRIRKLENRDNT